MSLKRPSSNASGALSTRIALLCAPHTGEAVEVLVQLMRSSDRDTVRLGAARAILDAAREVPLEHDSSEQQRTVYVLVGSGVPVPKGATVVDADALTAAARAKALGSGEENGTGGGR